MKKYYNSSMAGERIIVTNKSSRMVFDPNGSKIVELILNGHLVSETVRRGDGREASWHPSGPNFGVDPTGMFPNHGVLRNLTAEVLPLRAVDPPSSIRTSTTIRSDGYPEVDVMRILTLGPRSLTTEVIYLNNGDTPAPVNHGEHVYLESTLGWEEATLNNQPLADAIKSDTFLPWEDVNGLKIPGKPLLLLTQHGYARANPWTGKNSRGDFDPHYFSLSAVQSPQEEFGRLPSLVRPYSTSKQTSLTISIINP